MNIMDSQTMAALEIKIEDKARKLEKDAGFSGAWGDGGASDLRKLLRFYKAGRDRQIPEEWKSIVKKIKNENDQDWVLYLKLKQKFEGEDVIQVEEIVEVEDVFLDKLEEDLKNVRQTIIEKEKDTSRDHEAYLIVLHDQRRDLLKQIKDYKKKNNIEG